MNKTLSMYLKSCDDDTLYSHYEDVIHEMNRRKTEEIAKETSKYINFETLEEVL